MARFGGTALIHALGMTTPVAALLAAWGFPVTDAETQASRAFRESRAMLPRRVMGVVGAAIDFGALACFWQLTREESATSPCQVQATPSA